MMGQRTARPAVMAVDHRPVPALHFRVPAWRDDTHLVEDTIGWAVAAVDGPTRARLGSSPATAVLDVLQRPDGVDDEAAQVVADAIDEVIATHFPRVVPDASDVAYATDCGVVAHAAIVAAGLPVDTDRVAAVLAGMLTSTQQEVAG